MLKFSIFNNQTVKVSTSNETPEIKSFFRNKFSKDFENEQKQNQNQNEDLEQKKQI